MNSNRKHGVREVGSYYATSDSASDLSRKSAVALKAGIGDRIRHIRAALSQPVMAEKLHVSARTYGHWERSERTPDADALIQLVLDGWNANWVLTGEGQPRLDAQEPLQPALQSQSQDVSGEHLMVATELADEALHGLWLPRARYFELVGLIYDGLTQGLPYAQVLNFARPAASTLAMEQQGNDSEPPVAAPHKAGAG